MLLLPARRMYETIFCSKRGYGRMRIAVAAALFVFLLPLFSFSQKKFDFNNNCRQAYREIMKLRLADGQQILDEEKRRDPNNLIPYFLENYIDFFVLFFNEDPAEYAKRLPNREKRLDMMADGPSNSPFSLFTRAVIHFQWASVRIKFGDNWDAGWDFRKAFLQAKEDAGLFPGFTPAQLYSGAMQVAAGTIPDGYKWLGSLLGIRGSIKMGMDHLRRFLQGRDEWSELFREEGIFFYCYLKFYVENDRPGVFRFIADEHPDVKNNHLLAYLAANLHINNQQAEEAWKVLLEKNASSAYLDTPVWDMETGYARLHHLEPDAGVYFERFLAHFRGRFYVKDVLQKLSWYYYLRGDGARAQYYRAEVLKRGGTDTEADRQAQKDARNGVWPNKLLLQVRLLNDGGYHHEALKLLYGKKATDFSTAAEQLEFSYRVGRLYDDTGVDTNALIFYKEAIGLGEKRQEYYAARAALQIGYIYERKADCTSAMDWFRRCMNMKDHDFKNTLDQRARAGIARCKGE